MTQPTQAQAAFVCPKCGSRGYIKDGATTITAAAEVGEPSNNFTLEKRPVAWRFKGAIDEWILTENEEMANTAFENGHDCQGLYVRDGTPLYSVMDKAIAVTIERCAQLAEEISKGTGRNLSDVAAAIRALKENSVDDPIRKQIEAQLEGLAIGLEQRGEKSAAHIIRRYLTITAAAEVIEPTKENELLKAYSYQLDKNATIERCVERIFQFTDLSETQKENIAAAIRALKDK